MDREKLKAFTDAVSAMAKFREIFDRDLTPSIVAELYAADKLGLDINATKNEPGFDAVDSENRRYQIKYRSSNTLNVEINNFDFDYIVLVNVDDKYLLNGMWLATTNQAKQIFTRREKFRKYQATQKEFKAIAKRVI